MKWGIHPAGEMRAGWTSDDRRTTLLLLVQGEFRIDLTEGRRVLSKQGDYALWGPGHRSFMGSAGRLGDHHRSLAVSRGHLIAAGAARSQRMTDQ